MARRRGRNARYRMTPRRRAALKKAQAASARKRRSEGFNQFANTTKAILGAVAVGAAIHQLEMTVHDPHRVVRGYRGVKGHFGKTGDPNSPGMPPRVRTGLRHHGRPKVPLRRSVAGRRISPMQRRAHQGRLF